MKKNFLTIALLGLFSLTSAQFTVQVGVPSNFSANNAFLYSYNGSKEVIAANGTKSGNDWNFKVNAPYSGLMKVYFPDSNTAFMLVSENGNVSARTTLTNNKISNVEFSDNANKFFADYQGNAKKKEQILPVLLQMQNFYEPNSEFGVAMKKEISRLSAYKEGDISQYPFLKYYTENLQKYVDGNQALKQEDYVKFINNSPEYLESSAQIRQVLYNYLSYSQKETINSDVEKLLKTVDIESPRGQMVLSELIDFFDIYGMDDLKNKYLAEAKALKCTITYRLSTTIKSNDNVMIGKIMPDYKFNNPLNTTAKSIHDVKAKKKLIMFWSSTCSHCEAELPKIIESYKALQANGVQVIGLSLDADATSYNNRAKSLPWINDSELKGWNSSVSETYNVHATPMYFLLDASNKIIAKPNNFSEALSLIKVK
ncbi:TPA: TlpA family protein disulfide reductase [Elizabethkingia meningoseptica]|uniref:TlpA family protein disulfide reductase n=1 Tax=Elizabethkingia meningoseptica TaxID=238 RepID=UPI0022F19BF0|nr:TlpA disulfide reductase family protein [Elizabethkingia meningoseptica]EJK5330634.1 TlpA family protein disulfide reductase [Elizabethkingia meningoseptica]WBS76038.1 TlpA disulfide reductase family protein [Elizabethkingia meningoseptica]HAY3564210.1 TlpA family protein disulfide reductase [Elizabethkingia meningoseptica]